METATATPPRTRLRWPRGLIAFTALAVIAAAMLAAYQATLTPIQLIIDDQSRLLRTHQQTAGALLMDAGIDLYPEDIVVPGDPDTPLTPGMAISVQRARLISISADGHIATFRTHATSVEQALLEARVSVGPYDEIQVEGAWLTASRAAGHALPTTQATARDPIHITIRRAIPFTVYDDGQAATYFTTAPTVGEALHRIGVTLYLADGVKPALGERIIAGTNVYLDRSIPVTVQVDGRTLHTRTHREQVDEVLADLNIVLTGQDYALPPLDAPLEDDATVRVVRVTERFEVQQDPIPFELAWQPDPDLEIDHQRLLQEGARGIRERRIRVRFEDGAEVSRKTENVYVAVPPTTKIMGYGTKIVVRTMDTPDGPIEYWRTIRMLATSYSASTAGTPATASWYGRTRCGETMRFGIVAVDTRLISLRTHVYVHDYGVGYACDTGGAIRGRRIDLGYDDDNLRLWYRWVDVYLLTPVPPPDQINYIIN
jgi:uncharacterized protein YabE (DUF348 family)